MNAEQQFFLITTICYIVSIVAMWQTPLFKPFKLLAVFFHEFSHAIGATICCNRVTGLEISWNEGGLCTYQGVNANSMRSKCCVLPAGYIGSVLWGCFIIICTGWSAGPRVMGIIIIIALTIALGYAVCGVAKEMESRLTVIATALVFIALVLSITILDFSGNWEHSGFLLESVILYIGCCNMVFGTYDIYDDTVRRKDERSDAYKYAELAPCMFARCVGCVWFLIGLGCCVGAIVAGTVIPADNGVGKEGGDACTGCLPGWELVPGLVVLGISLGLTAFSYFVLGRASFGTTTFTAGPSRSAV